MEVGQNKDLVCYRKKQLELKLVLGLKGGLWVCRKSQKFSPASAQSFLSYVKKTPAGIGLRMLIIIKNNDNNGIENKEIKDVITKRKKL